MFAGRMVECGEICPECISQTEDHMKHRLTAFIAFAISLLLWAAGIYSQEPQRGAAAPGQQAAGAARGGAPGSESGWSTYQTRCAICHSNPGPDHGPSAESIRQMTPEKIYESLSTGKMKSQV